MITKLRHIMITLLMSILFDSMVCLLAYKFGVLKEVLAIWALCILIGVICFSVMTRSGKCSK